eukprot:TRINITY_DN5847_c0_g1_i1.p1 TRINITY_DN5847_c0_g1~~TRINITY_DN5847_c0_g1_i1.p1  ORF type:complete len:959 (+),score=192.84 TRINITY_DN5847_c0_g1_i1:334-3210(+)
MESLFSKFRYKVSADKYRYRDGSHDLDLTYITDRLIAMAFPSEGLESTYRNPIDQVADVCRENHGKYFLIFNLSERPYDDSKFDKQVITWCGFPDHLPPPWSLLFRIIQAIHDWLTKDPRNVVIIHCLAGKGRTGTIMACYFMYCGLFDSADEALNFFACKRSQNIWGVTGPAQLRYVNSFERMLKRNALPSKQPILLKSISFHTIPKYTISPGKQGICPLFEIYNVSKGKQLIYSSERLGEEIRSIPANLPGCTFNINCVIQGDILIVFKHITPLYGTENMFFYVFHTGMVENNEMILAKCELEKAHKDNRYAVDFTVSMAFSNIDPELLNNHPFKSIEDEIDFSIRPTDIPLDGSICFATYVPEKLAQAKDLANPQKGNTCEKGGYLVKRGHKVKNWKRRWFVLKDYAFSYMKSPRDSVPLGVIPIETMQKITMGVFSSEKPFCFEIQTYDKIVYLISADTEKEMRLWAHALAHARTLAKRTELQPSKKLYTSSSGLNLAIPPSNNNNALLSPSAHSPSRMSTSALDMPSNYSLLVNVHEVRLASAPTGEIKCTVSIDHDKFSAVCSPPLLSFNQSFTFWMNDTKKELCVSLWKSNPSRRIPDLIGETTIYVGDLLRTENQTTDEWYKLNKTGSATKRGSSIRIVLKLERADNVNFMNPQAIKPQLSPTTITSASPPSDEDQQFYASPSIPELRSSAKESPVISERRAAITIDGISLIELEDSDEEDETTMTITNSVDTKDVIAFNRWLLEGNAEPVQVVLQVKENEFWIAVGQTKGSILIYDAVTGRVKRKFATHEGKINAMQLISREVVWTAAESDLKAWNVNTGELIYQIPEVSMARTICLINNSSVWVGCCTSSSSGWSVMSWNPADIAQSKEILQIDHPIGCLLKHNDTVWVGTYTLIYVFHSQTSERIKVLKAHKTMVKAMVQYKNEIWSCSDDQVSGIRLWNAETYSRC